MTMRLNGKTINQLHRQAQKKADWLRKLNKNCSKALNRVSKLVSLAPNSLKTPNRITLVYPGNPNDFIGNGDASKISRALNAQVDINNPFPAQLGRITVQVTIVFLNAPAQAA